MCKTTHLDFSFCQSPVAKVLSIPSNFSCHVRMIKAKFTITNVINTAKKKDKFLWF